MVALVEPITMGGKLGLFALPKRIAAAVREQTGGGRPAEPAFAGVTRNKLASCGIGRVSQVVYDPGSIARR